MERNPLYDDLPMVESTQNTYHYTNNLSGDMREKIAEVIYANDHGLSSTDVQIFGKYTYEQLAKWALCGDPHAARRVLEWENILLDRIERAIYHAVKAERERASQSSTAVGGK